MHGLTRIPHCTNNLCKSAVLIRRQRIAHAHRAAASHGAKTWARISRHMLCTFRLGRSAIDVHVAHRNGEGRISFFPGSYSMTKARTSKSPCGIFILVEGTPRFLPRKNVKFQNATTPLPRMNTRTQSPRSPLSRKSPGSKDQGPLYPEKGKVPKRKVPSTPQKVRIETTAVLWPGKVNTVRKCNTPLPLK